MSPSRTRAPGPRRPTGPLPPAPAAPEPRRFDLYHMLSAVVGAYVGLVFYTLITPGTIPHEAAPTPDPRLSVTLSHITAKPSATGLFAITGQVHNGRDRACRLVGITVRFLDVHGTEVNHATTTVEDVPPGSDKAFDLRATAPGAVRFDTGVDMATF